MEEERWCGRAMKKHGGWQLQNVTIMGLYYEKAKREEDENREGGREEHVASEV